MTRGRPRNYARDLTDDERNAILDRNEYEPLADYPGDTSARWPARCCLCGDEVKVVLSNLVEQDESRNWPSRQEGSAFTRRRTRCSHNGGNRAPRSVPPLKYDEARALLKLLGEIDGAPGKTALATGLSKLRRIAGST